MKAHLDVVDYGPGSTLSSTKTVICIVVEYTLGQLYKPHIQTFRFYPRRFLRCTWGVLLIKA